MGSKTFDGVWFAAYVHDHVPPHVHARYGGVRVIIDLLPGGYVRKSGRWDAVTPSNGKRSDVRRTLVMAARHWTDLMQLWEKTHGSTS